MKSKQKKRNTNKFKKSIINKNVSGSFIKPVSSELPLIQLGRYNGYLSINDNDEFMEKFSNSISSMVRDNWVRLGVSLEYINDDRKSEYIELDNEVKYNSETFRRFGTRGKYYHLTSPKNYRNIMKNGLKSVNVKRMSSMGSSGTIWTIESDSPLIWNQVGFSQLGIGVEKLPMVVLEIDNNGIAGVISSEEINEFTSPLHTLIHQDIIEVKFIKPIGYFLTSKQHFYGLRGELGELKSKLYSTEIEDYKMIG